ncbi:NAD(P)H-quinone oxidoreductase [Luteimicrobium sp. DT211]|uniref:NAD(P)H-quinone oxidoreductase n=1 Tax=Luteimicrobium sp. DT211 TaxID=3393412 RepID=UPI003CED2B22
MRVVEIVRPGGPEQLAVREVADPVPGRGEVLVDVAAAGINRADLMQREGHYPPPPGAPSWPGLEASGTVAALGDDVDGWAVGDRVAALVAGGGYADRLVVPAGQLLRVPDSLDLVDAAGLPEAVCTAWSNLTGPGRLGRVTASGARVLVHGGSGGIGTVALQLLAALGAWTATTAGGPERVARCRELGADLAIDHRTEDFVAAVRDATDGRGVHVVLDVVGGAYLARNLEVLADEGRLVVIGTQRGRRAELDLGAVMARRLTVTGTTLRARSREAKAAIVADVAAHAWPWLDDGRLHPVIGARVPLDEAAHAHELVEAGTVFGKVLLVP